MIFAITLLDLKGPLGLNDCMVSKRLFGSSGIRGDAKELFTNQFSFDIGRTFSIFLKNHSLSGWCTIGNDPRESSPRINEAVTSGLIYEGREVSNQGVVPIPAMNYILKTDSAYSGSLMITGSHIKAHLNGVKFFAFGEEILKEHEKEIEEIYTKIKTKVEYKNLSSKITNEDRAKNSYQNYLLSMVKQKLPHWKVVVDPGNGAQSDVAPWVLTRLGLEVVEINSSIQENFLSRDTEVEGDFGDLQAKVKEVNADLGVGFDSDGDRVVFVDEVGSFIPGDYTGSLIAKHINTEIIVTPINVSQVVDHIGKRVIRTKVGSPYVVQKLKEAGSKFGFEANGGGIFSEMKTRDGGRTTIEVMNLLAASGKKLSQLVSELPKFYIARDKIDFKWEQEKEIVNKVKLEFKGIKVEEMDGLKIWIDETTWILFRSSQNAPEFRVFAESKSREEAYNLLKRGLDFVSKIVNS